MNASEGLIPEVVAEGPLQGWTTWRNIDPFEARAGPFFHRVGEDGRTTALLEVGPDHLNAGGFVHGGCLLAFADFCLFAIAMPELGDSMAVTVSLNAEFLDRVQAGDRVEASGELLRRARSLGFVQGVARVKGRPVLAFSGVIKLRAPAA